VVLVAILWIFVWEMVKHPRAYNSNCKPSHMSYNPQKNHHSFKYSQSTNIHNYKVQQFNSDYHKTSTQQQSKGQAFEHNIPIQQSISPVENQNWNL
jgi:hypothetical protein